MGMRYTLATQMQGALRLIYPPQCVSCASPTEAEGGLCGPCWRETTFLAGLLCPGCGAPLPGQDGPPAPCDDCLHTARPWAMGRAALAYRGTGRRLVLALKHGDRPDIARAAAPWLARAGAPLLGDDPLLIPVPLHRWRLWRRRYNQSALLAGGLARLTGLTHIPDALLRHRATPGQDHRTRDQRFANLEGAISLAPRHRARLAGRAVVLIDDVMTSGATLAACAEALRGADLAELRVLVLARVGRGD